MLTLLAQRRLMAARGVNGIRRRRGMISKSEILRSMSPAAVPTRNDQIRDLGEQ